jgi:hypothetical protein
MLGLLLLPMTLLGAGIYLAESKLRKTPVPPDAKAARCVTRIQTREGSKREAAWAQGGYVE